MDPTYTAEYELYETHHWWHVARLELIHRCLDRYVPHVAEGTRWLDVGCGTGVLLASYPRIRDRMGVELDAPSVATARQKGLDVREVGEDWDLSAYGQFDLVTACDVIEHVKDDALAVAKLGRALRPGGLALVTVPALPSLWSAHDVRNHHFRRYRRGNLLACFGHDDWEVVWCSYFSSLLLPLIWTVRKAKNMVYGVDPAVVPTDKKLGPRPVDAALLAVFRLECRLLRLCRMPLGSSLILVARKR